MNNNLCLSYNEITELMCKKISQKTGVDIKDLWVNFGPDEDYQNEACLIVQGVDVESDEKIQEFIDAFASGSGLVLAEKLFKEIFEEEVFYEFCKDEKHLIIKRKIVRDTLCNPKTNIIIYLSKDEIITLTSITELNINGNDFIFKKNNKVLSKEEINDLLEKEIAPFTSIHFDTLLRKFYIRIPIESYEKIYS